MCKTTNLDESEVTICEGNPRLCLLGCYKTFCFKCIKEKKDDTLYICKDCNGPNKKYKCIHCNQFIINNPICSKKNVNA